MDRRSSSNGLHQTPNRPPAQPSPAQPNAGKTQISYETAEAEEAINGPIVFSCSKCRTILGDTFAYAASLPERNYFGLHAVPESIVCQKTKKTSDEGIYHELCCIECQTPVGRKYLTTSEELDSIRGLYALDIGQVMTYELGKCLKSEVEVEQPTKEFYTSVAFREDLVMVKNNVTAVAARLQRLEQILARNGTPGSLATSPRATASGSRKRQSAGAADLYQVDPSKRFNR
ncbi:hypothetical protein GGI07_002918 [Coemansia sp. Benny D115]|nr:hypothetical protein GGI07_002918 [Coemansia sp. Benny D115]